MIELQKVDAIDDSRFASVYRRRTQSVLRFVVGVHSMARRPATNNPARGFTLQHCNKTDRNGFAWGVSYFLCLKAGKDIQRSHG